MSWWSPSWLPSLPSLDFALPSSIQRRFISFGLRQTLGHFVKPGQLDIQQVDSQIGSGYVQIRDIELNNEAINTMITDLPIELHDGSVGKVTARIPWPNPLTASVGLSLESLHLTFYLSPSSPSHEFVDATHTLAESVASVAETFIHEELTTPEENELRESFHTDLTNSTQSFHDHVPGGLDPFLSDADQTQSDIDPPGVSMFAALIERLLARFQFDATDTKITLVHPEHASFTVSIPDIKYGSEVETASSPDVPNLNVTAGTKRTLTISNVVVTTRCLRPPTVVTYTPTTLSPQDTFAFSSNHESPFGQSPPRSPSVSSTHSDSSDMDEETQLRMSQSIAFLPPRPVSPASSVASSMYQSAISTSPMIKNDLPPVADVPEEDHEPTDAFLSPQSDYALPVASNTPPPEIERPLPPAISTITTDIKDETIFSLSSEPILITLMTPSVRKVVVPTSTASSSKSQTKPVVADATQDDRLELHISVGITAVAVKAQHIRDILDIADIWVASSPHSRVAQTSASEEPTPSLLDQIETDVRLRGIMVLLLPEQNVLLLEGENAISEFFSHPLVPPSLPHSFVRVQLENIHVALSLRTIRSNVTSRSKKSLRTSKQLSCSAYLSELSVFAFTQSQSAQPLVSPILITDPNLSSQYQTSHRHPNLLDDPDSSSLPSFDVVDWTDPRNQRTGPKLSHWRHRTHANSTTPSTSPQAKLGPSPPHDMASPPQHRAITLHFNLHTTPSTRPKTQAVSSELKVDIAPLHLMVDLSILLDRSDSGGKSEFMKFVEQVLTSGVSPRQSYDDDDDSLDGRDEDDEADTPPATPRQTEHMKREQERLRLERMVLEDLDLGFDYAGLNSSQKKKSGPLHSTKAHRQRVSYASVVSVNLPMIRMQIRGCPPIGSQPRSGAVIVDIHELSIHPGGNTPSEDDVSLRFAEPQDMPLSYEHARELLLSANFKRINIAYCPVPSSKATSLLSLGSLSNPEAGLADGGIAFQPPSGDTRTKQSPTPHISVSKSLPSKSPTLSTIAVTIDIPSVYVNLSKPVIDGLQLWADDLTQLLERAFSPVEVGDTSRDTSLIGSRYFVQSKQSRGSANSTDRGSIISGPSDAKTETIVKIIVSEAAVRLAIPRGDNNGVEVRPFDILASDLDLLLELKPEGKDETVVTLAITDLNIFETTKSGSRLTFLSLTIPRHLTPSGHPPIIKVGFTSLVVPGTTAKESRIKVTLCGFTYDIHPDIHWLEELARFAKAPPGAFESVVPSERTSVSLKVVDTSIRAFAPTYPGSVVVHMDDISFNTVLVGNGTENSFHLIVQQLSLLLIDDVKDIEEGLRQNPTRNDRSNTCKLWKTMGYALFTELTSLDMRFHRTGSTPAQMRIDIEQLSLRLHLCADTATALTAFITSITSLFANPAEDSPPPERRRPTEVSERSRGQRSMLASLDEHAFRRLPEVGATADMIYDDLPTNPDYLDESFSAAGGLRELTDDDLDDFGSTFNATDQPGVISKYGGETIRILQPEGLQIIEHYYNTLPPDANDEGAQYGETTLRVRVRDCDVTLFLYDGYDWARTRRIIEEEEKKMRRKLAKIRQLVANGQTPDPSVEETNTLLFNSVYIGLDHNVDELEPGALLAAIDDELDDDADTASQSSWQSLKPQAAPASPGRAPSIHRSRRHKAMKRSKGPSIEFKLLNLSAEIDNYRDHPELASRTLIMLRDIEILDHIKTSTWKKFLTSLRTDSKGNVRETDSYMARVELRKVYPVPGNPAEEARLRAKILPLRLHVDQDALDFLKKFFSFKDPEAAPAPSAEPAEEIFFQQAEVFPVDLKLDYKPRRVDYRALRDGKTIELMNFFHFDGAEMTLRHITLTGITGWPRFFDMLNDLWTPDVKATQLVDVISGVAPIRSVVNVGSGVADLVLLPIAQYRKDGRVVRGLQKGTTAFVKSTAIEAIKLGARLATGTQVILEQAETVLGGQFKDPITAEALQAGLEGYGYEAVGMGDEILDDDDLGEGDLISRYADQPSNVKEGVKFAYKSLRKNLNSAAQTILAVPMEVYERSGNEGTVRAVVRAVPIAVLKPMIGASEAVSKTLLGLHNTLDPSVRLENEEKYKSR
ncbi:hypothetical protein C8Q75DRAFT_709658 [Abortiporus biennis]|nr:hypothetical protein C8Q75DRAFT_709658 [Abortiporus biennis]